MLPLDTGLQFLWSGKAEAQFATALAQTADDVTEDDPQKPHEEDAEATPEWHRARANQLWKNGFTKMAHEHERIGQLIESRRQGRIK